MRAKTTFAAASHRRLRITHYGLTITATTPTTSAPRPVTGAQITFSAHPRQDGFGARNSFRPGPQLSTGRGINSALRKNVSHAPVTTCRGFTLVEIMVVVGIMILIMSIGIPSMFHSLRKDPMRQAVSDIMDACTQARAHAILRGVPAEIQFRPQNGSFNVAMSSQPPVNQGFPGPISVPLDARPASSSTAPGPSFSAQLSNQLVVEMLDVNFQELKDEQEARVRFFPNGTCDEFTIVLRWPEKGLYRKITLDIISSLADMEVIR